MSRVERHILIRVGREAALAAVRNVELFPKPMGEIESVTLLSRSQDLKEVTTEWVAHIPKPRRVITWSQEEIWVPEQGTCTFRQISGDFDEFSGSWSFTEIELGLTRFDLVVNYRLEIPLIGGLFRSAIQQSLEELMASFQKGMKNRCEGN